MEKRIAAAEKEALVDIVKMVQRRGLKGEKGRWKEFLIFHDRKMGTSISDPAKRSVNDLVAFLQTFTEEEDLKFFVKILQCHSNRKAVENLIKSSTELESPQQRLVRLTLEHPEYPLNYSFPSHNKEWMVTNLGKISKALKSNAMIAVDCEMVLCQDDTEEVVKVCVVDQNLEVKLNEIVNPNKSIADYRTDITGISAEHLERVTCSLADIQKSMKKLLSHGTILVGHGLNNDLQALKIDHARVVDTSFIFKNLDGPTRKRPSLNSLCKAVLGYEVRKEGAPHNCLDDACAAMKLVLAKMEHGFDDGIAWTVEEVPENEPAKLLLHRIPIDVPREELQKTFPKHFTFELQPRLRVRGKQYSVFANFKDPHEAHEAFDSINSDMDKDSQGRPQKLVSFELKTGLPVSFYVRKMLCTEPLNELTSLKKRSIAVENTEEPKKPKTEPNQCHHHTKEIVRLKQELHKREDEIASLQKIIAALTRKHGL